MNFARCALVLATVVSAFGQNPTWDNTGNSLLKGTYYFRHVTLVVGDIGGDLSGAAALYGNITFDGSGKYTMSATAVISGSQTQTGTLTGTYSIAASGYGFLSNPLLSNPPNVEYIYGLVSQQGIFVGSSSESGYNDLFIAAPIGATQATNSMFRGTYWIADMDLSSGYPQTGISSLFQLNPDGAGNLGSVSLTGYVGAAGSQQVTQTVPAAKYIFTNGAGVITFSASANPTLIAGQRYLYISPSGDFVFGGSPNSWDMFVGVRTGTGTVNFGGLYYQAGIDQDDSHLASGVGLLDTYFGSLNANGGAVLEHQRQQDVLFTPGTLDATYNASYTLKSDGTYATPFMRYVVGAGGAVRIGSGIGPYLGVNVALQAPTFTGTGVFLNPTGIVNAASSSPFTAALAPGELITLYGTNLAPEVAFAQDTPFPATLKGVQVMVNGVAAPLYYVSPTQISAIIPYGIATTIAQIQVINNGENSNIVTNFMGLTAPGIFTNPPGGIGYGAILHENYDLITSTSPARAGETVQVYCTGLGIVAPAISDGAVGPTDVLSKSANVIQAYIGGVQATVTYAGLAPQLAGLYQINVTVPAGLTAGDNTLEIIGPDSDAAQALLPIAGASTSSAVVQPHLQRH